MKPKLGQSAQREKEEPDKKYEETSTVKNTVVFSRTDKNSLNQGTREEQSVDRGEVSGPMISHGPQGGTGDSSDSSDSSNDSSKLKDLELPLISDSCRQRLKRELRLNHEKAEKEKSGDDFDISKDR